MQVYLGDLVHFDIADQSVWKQETTWISSWTKYYVGLGNRAMEEKEFPKSVSSQGLVCFLPSSVSIHMYRVVQIDVQIVVNDSPNIR